MLILSDTGGLDFLDFRLSGQTGRNLLVFEKMDAMVPKWCPNSETPEMLKVKESDIGKWQPANYIDFKTKK